MPVGLLVRGAATPGAPDRMVVAATRYADRARRLLLAYKEEGRHELVGVLAPLLARAVLGALLGAGPVLGPDGPPSFWLVPVPSRPRSRRRRGADVGLLLARRTAQELRALGWPAAVAPLLRHRARSVDQAGLGRDERQRNVAGTLVAQPRPAGRGVCRSVVVDDIVTTGATLDEAFRALDGAGWPMLGGAVVAATPGRVTPLEVAREGV